MPAWFSARPTNQTSSLPSVREEGAQQRLASDGRYATSQLGVTEHGRSSPAVAPTTPSERTRCSKRRAS